MSHVIKKKQTWKKRNLFSHKKHIQTGCVSKYCISKLSVCSSLGKHPHGNKGQNSTFTTETSGSAGDSQRLKPALSNTIRGHLVWKMYCVGMN